MSKSGVIRLVLGAMLVLAGFAAREALAPRPAVAQFTADENAQLAAYEVTFAGNDGVWKTEQIAQCRYSVEGGALVLSNPFTNQLMKAYAPDSWISVRQILPQ